MEEESPFLDCAGEGATNPNVVTSIVIETIEDHTDIAAVAENVPVSVTPVTVTVEGDSVEEDATSSGEACVSQTVFRNTLKRKNGRNFLVKSAVLELLLHAQSEMVVVPIGSKRGQYFLLKDDRNFFKGRRRLAKNTFKIDEHDNWQHISLKKHYYLYLQGRFKYVDYIGGKYQLYQAMPGEKSKRHPMEKQPSPDEILVIRKLHSVIPGVMRRRISYIEKLPRGVEPKQLNLFLVEYRATIESIATKSPKLDETADSSIGSDSDISDICEFVDNRSEEIAVEFHTYPNMLHLEPQMLEEVPEPKVKGGSENRGVFFDKNEVIEILISAESHLDEIPAGLKEDEYFVVKNNDNYQRELEGKRRLYIDDCGVWKNVSMKRHFYVKVQHSYFPVDCLNGRYQISNIQIRSKHTAVEEKDVLALRKVYGTLKRCEEYKRRICWIDKFPEGVTPRQQHISLVEYVGKYPKEVPHGNHKKPNAVPYVRTPRRVMQRMKEEVAHKTVKEVIAEFPGIETSSRQVKQLHNLRYRSTMRIGPGSAKNEVLKDEMQELNNLVQSHPYVQTLTLTKYKSPMVVAYTAQQLNSWKYHCQERSGLDRVLGVDRTFNIGPVCLTILIYPHPNLLCRKTQRQAVMMGPILFHVDKSWSTYSLLFNHISGCLSPLEKADVDGISVACKTEEEKPIMEALNRSFSNAIVTLCAEHLKMDLKQHLMKLAVGGTTADGIVKEIFGELTSCTEEYDFDCKLVNLQSEYDVTIPEFSTYFRKLCENIRHSLWRPTMERNPLLQWSQETCHALKDLAELSKDWSQIKLPRLIQNIYEIVSLQEQEEIRAIQNEGRYVLASHARKYLVNRTEWGKKTSKQKARLAENMRKVKPGAVRSSVRRIRTKEKPDIGHWDMDQQYY